MAKQTVGPIIQHLEKAVLGIAVLILLGAVALYGVMSPNKVGDEKLGPGDVDREVRTSAENLLDKLRNSPPNVPEPSPPVRAIQDAEDPVKLAKIPPTLPAALPFGPPVPSLTSGPGATVTLAEAIAPAAPVVVLGRSGIHIPAAEPFEGGSAGGGTGGGGGGGTGSEAAGVADANWVTVATVFDRQKQEATFKQAGYDAQGEKVLFLGMDVERRALKADGDWDEWAAVPQVSIRQRPAYPTVKLEESSGRLDVVPEQRTQVVNFIELISKGNNQLDLMRPLFPRTEYGDAWKYPRTGDYDAVQLDAEYLPDGACRYPECGGAGGGAGGTGGPGGSPKATPPPVNTNLNVRELLKKTEEALKAGNLDEAASALDEAKKKTDLKEPDKKKITALEDQLVKARAAKPATTAAAPVQILWAHDAQPESAKSGRTYQYRCRVRLFNRYAATPTTLAEPRDAEKIELVSAWSEPSDPVTIPLDTVVFVKSSKPDRHECKVDVFKWVAGETLRRTFDVKVGERIGDVQRVDTPKGQRQPVDFDTGATVVDIDFKRSIRPPARKGGKPGQNVETTALVYVDDSGELHERLLDLDKISQEYKDKSAKVWKESKETP